MESVDQFNVELIYINPPNQHIQQLSVSRGDTLRKAIQDSGVLEKFSEIDLTVNKVGIYNKLEELDYQLQDGDRIEIYRALKIDPKEARRKRAQKS